MEYPELVGTRRSIRYFDPDRPVEREKVQTILEACLLASCAVNAHWLKAVVVERDQVTTEDLERMKHPTQAVIISLAPVHIYFYCDLGVIDQVKGTRLKELIDVGALNPTHGWSYKFVDEVVYPQLLKPLAESPNYAVFAAFDCGIAVCQGLLMAFHLGLGAVLTAFLPDVVSKYTNPPASWLPLHMMNVGYSAESREAGGQRPRPPFGEQYFLGRYGNPFPRDPEVVEDLKRERMLQPRAPLPGRKEDIRILARRLGLPE